MFNRENLNTLGKTFMMLCYLAAAPMANATMITSVPAPAPSSATVTAVETVESVALQPETVDLTGAHAVSGAAMAVTPAAATPEPASFLFLGTGLIAFAVFTRRSGKRRRQEGGRLTAKENSTVVQQMA